MLSIRCPNCSANIPTAGLKAGSGVICPGCQEAFRLGPKSSYAAVPPPPPPPAPPPSLPLPVRVADGEPERERHRRTERPVEPPSGAVAASLGLGSIILGVVALPFSLIPCLGALSLPLAGLGFLLGLIGILLA